MITVIDYWPTHNSRAVNTQGISLLKCNFPLPWAGFQRVTSEELDLILLFEVFSGVILVLANNSWLLSWESRAQELDLSFFVAEIQKAAGKWRQHLNFQWCGVAAVWVQDFMNKSIYQNVCIKQLGEKKNQNKPHKCKVLTFRCSQVNQNHFIFLHGLETILETSLKVWFQNKWLFVWRPLKIQAVFQEGLAESRGIVLFFWDAVSFLWR